MVDKLNIKINELETRITRLETGYRKQSDVEADIIEETAITGKNTTYYDRYIEKGKYHSVVFRNCVVDFRGSHFNNCRFNSCVFIHRGNKVSVFMNSDSEISGDIQSQLAKEYGAEVEE